MILNLRKKMAISVASELNENGFYLLKKTNSGFAIPSETTMERLVEFRTLLRSQLSEVETNKIKAKTASSSQSHYTYDVLSTFLEKGLDSDEFSPEKIADNFTNPIQLLDRVLRNNRYLYELCHVVFRIRELELKTLLVETKTKTKTLTLEALKTNKYGYYLLKKSNFQETLRFNVLVPASKLKILTETLIHDLSKTVVKLSYMPQILSKTKRADGLIGAYYLNGGEIPGFNASEGWPSKTQLWTHCRYRCPRLTEYFYLLTYLINGQNVPEYSAILEELFKHHENDQALKENRCGFYLLAPKCKKNNATARFISYEMPQSVSYEKVEIVSKLRKKYLEELGEDLSVLERLVNRGPKADGKGYEHKIFQAYFFKKGQVVFEKNYKVKGRSPTINLNEGWYECKENHKEFFEFLHILVYLKENEENDQRCGALLKELLSSESVAIDSSPRIEGLPHEQPHDYGLPPLLSLANESAESLSSDEAGGGAVALNESREDVDVNSLHGEFTDLHNLSLINPSIHLEKNPHGYYWLAPKSYRGMVFRGHFTPDRARVLANTLREELSESTADLSHMPSTLFEFSRVFQLVGAYYLNGGDIPGFTFAGPWPDLIKMWEHCNKHCPKLLESFYLFSYLVKRKDNPIFNTILLDFLGRDVESDRSLKLNRCGFYLLVPNQRGALRGNGVIPYKISKSVTYEKIKIVSELRKKELDAQGVDLFVLEPLVNGTYVTGPKRNAFDIFRVYFSQKDQVLFEKNYKAKECNEAWENCKETHKAFFELLYILNYLKENEAVDQRYGELLKDLLSSESAALASPPPLEQLPQERAEESGWLPLEQLEIDLEDFLNSHEIGGGSAAQLAPVVTSTLASPFSSPETTMESTLDTSVPPTAAQLMQGGMEIFQEFHAQPVGVPMQVEAGAENFDLIWPLNL